MADQLFTADKHPAFVSVRSEEPRAASVVVVGGGTGAPLSISVALSLGFNVDAVVAMADDGRSTGILRTYQGVTPPGDVRKCLAAMAADQESPLTQAFQKRLTLEGKHSLGNLILAALEQTGTFPQAIEVCEQLLNTRGHVYPSTLQHVLLEARTADGEVVHGQDNVCHSQGRLSTLWLASDDGSPLEAAYAPALEALRNADFIVLGPGSLYTSIVANLLVPGVSQAICESRAKVVFVSGLSDAQGESRGLSITDQVRALESYGLEGRIDVVVAHEGARTDSSSDEEGHILTLSSGEEARLERGEIHVCRADVVDEDNPEWHDGIKLRAVFERVLR